VDVKIPPPPPPHSTFRDVQHWQGSVGNKYGSIIAVKREKEGGCGDSRGWNAGVRCSKGPPTDPLGELLKGDFPGKLGFHLRLKVIDLVQEHHNWSDTILKRFGI